MNSTYRRSCSRVLPILFLFAATGMQAATIYTNSLSEFLSKLQPGYQVQTFDSYASATVTGPIDFSSGIFSYSALDSIEFCTNDISGGDIVFSTNWPYDPITFTFTSGNVTAVGGYFWNTDFYFNAVSDPILLALNDGTSVTVPSVEGGSFFGFYSDRPIVSLSITPSGTAEERYATVNNLYLGQNATPEPATIACVSGGLLALVALRRRLRR